MLHVSRNKRELGFCIALISIIFFCYMLFIAYGDLHLNSVANIHINPQL